VVPYYAPCEVSRCKEASPRLTTEVSVGLGLEVSKKTVELSHACAYRLVRLQRHLREGA
jgi:hypothetical protein